MVTFMVLLVFGAVAGISLVATSGARMSGRF
jgi:hypothetical protein